MLNPELTKRTEAFYVEDPEDPHYLLTIATDFTPKPPFSAKGNSTYAIYHKTDWEVIPKIFSEQLIRPEAWSVDSHATDSSEFLPSWVP